MVIDTRQSYLALHLIMNRNGDDGQFATFKLNVGTPSQEVHLLPDPFRSALVIVGKDGCLEDSLIDNCGSKRGNVFDLDHSQSWHDVDGRAWDPTETIIVPPRQDGLNGTRRQNPMFQHPVTPGSSSKFGVDKIAGTSAGKDWSITEQGIMSISNMYPFVGRLGLSSQLNGGAKNPVSLFDNLRAIHKMKSVSWSYTAGNKASKLNDL